MAVVGIPGVVVTEEAISVVEVCECVLVIGCNMLCKNPYMQGDLPFGCGQCLPCRISKGRLWTNRIMLEAMKHGDASFVTLTYKESELPKGGTLVKRHYQKFLKRLRKAMHPVKIRYFLVGEYGDRSGRPHYHAAIYGLSELDAACVQKCWPHGFVYVGSLTKDSAQYVARYVTKKMTHDEEKCTEKCTHPPLAGREPEFARMSLRPGIGALAVNEIASMLETTHGCHLVAMEGDVPQSLRMGRRDMPLGRYLREKIREKMGFPEKGVPKEKLREWMREMSQLYKETEAELNIKRRFTPKNVWKKELLIDRNRQKVERLEKRFKLKSKKGMI